MEVEVSRENVVRIASPRRDLAIPHREINAAGRSEGAGWTFTNCSRCGGAGFVAPKKPLALNPLVLTSTTEGGEGGHEGAHEGALSLWSESSSITSMI